jgi:hypothetical protein
MSNNIAIEKIKVSPKKLKSLKEKVFGDDFKLGNRNFRWASWNEKAEAIEIDRLGGRAINNSKIIFEE